MSKSLFSHPIDVRYGDLDPQGHVNNANFLTYLEQARIHYLIHLGLFAKNRSFMEVGIILADVHLTFLKPVLFGMAVLVETWVSRLGNKSLTMNYRMIDVDTSAELARATTVLVTYDFMSGVTIPIPTHWREKIRMYEDLVE